jgi:hypothetical protein
MDAVADIVGVCMLLDELAPDVVAASPVNTGKGSVRCAHGTLPVPAPATARILRGVPIYSDDITGELCTPTGAALLKHFVKSYCDIPAMIVDKIGYGMGTKDFAHVNCVRAFFGESAADTMTDRITELSCNLDDMTPEEVAFAQGLLMERGALDVTVTPTVMKKGRAGVILSCMCKNDDKELMTSLVFKHTTTIGLRESTVRRRVMARETVEAQTEFGKVRLKVSRGFGAERVKAEYDDVAGIIDLSNK